MRRCALIQWPVCSPLGRCLFAPFPRPCNVLCSLFRPFLSARLPIAQNQTQTGRPLCSAPCEQLTLLCLQLSLTLLLASMSLPLYGVGSYAQPIIVSDDEDVEIIENDLDRLSILHTHSSRLYSAYRPHSGGRRIHVCPSHPNMPRFRPRICLPTRSSMQVRVVRRFADAYQGLLRSCASFYRASSRAKTQVDGYIRCGKCHLRFVDSPCTRVDKQEEQQETAQGTPVTPASSPRNLYHRRSSDGTSLV